MSMIATETDAVIIPIFKPLGRGDGGSKMSRCKSPEEAHEQAAMLAKYSNVERVIVRIETTYTSEDSDDVQDDTPAARPRAFGSARN